MTQETESASPVLTAASEVGPDLGDFITGLLDGYPTPQPHEDDEPEVLPASAGGETPTAHPGETAATPTASEGATPATPGDTPAAGAEPTASDQAGTQTPELTEEEFLAQTKPFTYTVDNRVEQLEGIRVTDDGAGIVDPKTMAVLQQRLSQGDHYFRQSREQYEQLKRYDGVAEWNLGGGKKLTGLEAIREQQISSAGVRAQLAVVLDAIKNPAQFRQLVSGYDQEKDLVILNEPVLNALMMQAENISLKARDIINDRFRSIVLSAPAPEQVDVEKSAPAILNAVAHKLGKTVHADDAKNLEGILPRFIRPATAADVQKYPQLKIGEQVVDEKFDSQVLHLTGLREQNQTTMLEREKAARAEAAKTAEAAKRNAAKTAATQTRALTATPVPAGGTPKPKTRQQEQDEFYARRERNLANAIPR